MPTRSELALLPYSLKHLPEYIKAVDELKAKKVDLVACVSANDAFVMDAWGKSLGADGKVTMLADGGAKFAKAMAVELDLTDRNIGIRSQRYSAIIDNLQVRSVPEWCDDGAFMRQSQGCTGTLNPLVRMKDVML